MNKTERFQTLLQKIVSQPGVYIMKNAAGTILYIGKARNLRKRVRQYFGKSHDKRWFIEHLKELVHDIETITTENESEALLLESTLIKKHHPLFNIYFRDDKSYQKMALTTSEKYPRLLLTRQVKEDRNRYFGPYVAQGNIKDLYRFIQKNFPLRKCSNNTFKNRRRPCLYYEMEQCLAPCCHPVSRATYGEIIDEVTSILEGRFSQLRKKLDKRMWEAAEEASFEKASRYKNLIQALDVIAEKQNVDLLQNIPRGTYHFWNYAKKEQFMQIQNFIFSEGRLIASQSFHYDNVYEEPAESLISFLAQYYTQKQPAGTCRLILPPNVIPQGTALRSISSRLVVLKKLRKPFKDVLELAQKNSREQLEGYLQAHKKNFSALRELQEALHSGREIVNIECYDISHLSGAHTVGVKVAFRRGVPEKSLYRIYNIHHADGNDIKALEEVFRRRLRRSATELPPDIMMVDGGKQQLAILNRIRQETDNHFFCLAIAKERINRQKPDIIYYAHPEKGVIELSFSRETHYFLQKIRDETHRFARQSMMRRHKKEQVRHPILKIPRIGKAKLNIILRHFSTSEELKKAQPEEIKKIEELSKKDIENILQYRDIL